MTSQPAKICGADCPPPIPAVLWRVIQSDGARQERAPEGYPTRGNLRNRHGLYARPADGVGHRPCIIVWPVHPRWGCNLYRLRCSSAFTTTTTARANARRRWRVYHGLLNGGRRVVASPTWKSATACHALPTLLHWYLFHGHGLRHFPVHLVHHLAAVSRGGCFRGHVLHADSPLGAGSETSCGPGGP